MSSCPAMTLADERTYSQWRQFSARASQACHHFLSSVWVLAVCKTIIGAVAAVDTYLTIKYAISLDIYEQNPVGRWMMGLDDGPVSDTQQIAAFIAAKFFGTIVVLIALELLASWRARLGGIVALPVTVFQLTLISHLLYGVG